MEISLKYLTNSNCVEEFRISIRTTQVLCYDNIVRYPVM